VGLEPAPAYQARRHAPRPAPARGAV